MTKTLNQSTIREYNRDPNRVFTDFPHNELAGLANIIDFHVPDLGVAERINRYFQQLNLLGIDPETKALIGHCITSYLDYCIETDCLWAAQFLFPPQLDPATETDYLESEGDIATNVFKVSHIRRNVHLQSELLQQILLNPNPAIVFINGPMYSAKSGQAAMLYGALSPVIPRDHLHPIIWAGMGEDYIHARSLPSADIPATPLSLSELQTKVQELILQQKSRSILQRCIVIIEEATFFASAETPEQEALNAQLFEQAINQLKEGGISVVLIGLARNYRDNDLPVTARLKQNNSVILSNCNSFHLHPSPNGHVISRAETTGRYTVAMGMFDWIFPIVVPRVQAHGVEYAPLPEEFHPFAVLKKCDPQLYKEIIGIERPDILEAHTQMVLSQQSSSEA